jgi:ligand-binding sensor domain-containing protein/serine phosphatase RsbU (regulator of sigma subunit)
MPVLTHQRSYITTLLFLLLSPIIVDGQSYQFKKFGTDNRLPDKYIYSITQDNSRFLWISTGSGLVKFDGLEFYSVSFPDTITNRYASVSLKDRNGNLWFGCNDGSLFYTSENRLVKMQDLKIQSINCLFESEDGYLYVIPQDKMILKININRPDEITRYYLSVDLSMTTACLISPGNLLIGTQENLFYCSLRRDSVLVNNTVTGIENTKIEVVRPLKEKGVYLVGTDGNGLFMVTIRDERPVLSRFRNHPEFETLNIKSLSEDSEGYIWVSTFGSGVFQIKISATDNLIDSVSVYNTLSGLPGQDIKTVFQDMEGNIWIGFYGEGFSLLGSEAFSSYSPAENPENNDIIFIDQVNDKYLLGTPKGYYLFNVNTNKTDAFVDLGLKTGRAEISAYLMENNNLWIGTKGNGLYLRSPRGEVTLFYRSENSGENNIRQINADLNDIWLATLDGVIVLDRNSGTVRKKFKIEDRLPHNSINQVFLQKDGRALVATECDRLYYIDLNAGVTNGNKLMVGNTKNKVLCYTESKDGDIWAGTSGNGVFYFQKDTVSRLTTVNGLWSNYCYSILADSYDKIWIGHERGFSRFDKKTGAIKVYTTEFAKGKAGDCNPNSLIETSDGKIVLGTTEGLLVYDRMKDRKKLTAPLNTIISVTINDIKYPYRKLYMLPYNKYTIKIDYVGINLSDPDKVYYSTKLDNWDDKWSDLNQSRQATYSLKDGRYRFNLVSFNEEGLTQENPGSFEIFIKQPFWRTWWFIISAVLISAGIVALIMRQREKAQKKIKEYLESELAERTKQVLKQKNEIELQNIEITDSINYAKRIQSSILPDVNKLAETFKDAFIFFHPRDIVSGDFYWFDKITDDKFIVVCADSTGHGVPGAFMSMIGSTLLQDIVARKGVTKPSQIITLLDKQIFTTLNQNIDIGVSNDGMDMVVCEFNIKTRYVRFASAMRPLIIVLQGTPYYIKGNRYSVGGESVVEKYFDDQEYYLNEGDIIYMFSDGLPDQFGGPDGKKMKIARLKKLIESVRNMPMHEQKEKISNYYFEWKGDYEQVDDILFMGIRI